MNEDIFNHLIEVEGEAANMLFEAQVEADDKVSAVKKKADEDYKKEIDDVKKALNAKFEKEKERIDEEAQKELNDYLTKLKTKHVDYDAFKEMIDKYFFGQEKVNVQK